MWAGTTTVRVGDHHLGVRAYPDALHAALQQFFAADADDSVAAPPNLSVRWEALAVGSPSFVLHQDHTAVLSTRSARRLLQALPRYLEGLVQPSDHPTLLVADAAAFARDGTAVLAPATLRRRLPQLAPRLRRAGIACLDGLRPVLDPASAELVVDPRSLSVDWSAAASLQSIAPEPRTTEPTLAAGRYRLGSWLVAAADTQRRSWAGRVAAVVSLLSTAGADQQRLERCAELMGRVVLRGIGEEDAPGVARTIVDTLSQVEQFGSDG